MAGMSSRNDEREQNPGPCLLCHSLCVCAYRWGKEFTAAVVPSDVPPTRLGCFVAVLYCLLPEDMSTVWSFVQSRTVAGSVT